MPSAELELMIRVSPRPRIFRASRPRQSADLKNSCGSGSAGGRVRVRRPHISLWCRRGAVARAPWLHAERSASTLYDRVNRYLSLVTRDIIVGVRLRECVTPRQKVKWTSPIATRARSRPTSAITNCIKLPPTSFLFYITLH